MVDVVEYFGEKPLSNIRGNEEKKVISQYKPIITEKKITQEQALQVINKVLEPHNLVIDKYGLERMVNDIGILKDIAENMGGETYFDGLGFQYFITRVGEALPGTCKQKNYATEINK